MAKDKYKISLLMFLLGAILFVPSVLAANTATLVSPAADARITGSYLLNASVDTNSLVMENATFYYSSDSGATWTEIASVANDTATAFNITWNSAGVVDDEGLIFNVTIRNATAIITDDTSTGVGIDNGVPTASWGSSSFTDNLGLISTTAFTVGLAADSTIGISNCTATFTNNDDSSTVTLFIAGAGNVCSNTTATPSALSLAINSDYSVVVQAVDGNSNTTDSSTRTLRVTPAAGGGGGGTDSGGTDDGTDGDDSNEGTGSTGTSKGFWTWIGDIISAPFRWLAKLFS